MNEITAAIGERAFRIYGSGSNNAAMSYIRGQQDAIGFMLKFVEWKEKFYELSARKEKRGLCYSKEEREKATGLDYNLTYYTTEQLLLKYMEDTKL